LLKLSYENKTRIFAVIQCRPTGDSAMLRNCTPRALLFLNI